MFGIFATLLLLISPASAQDPQDICVDPPAEQVFVSPSIFRYAMLNLYSHVGSIQVIPLNDQRNFHVLVELQPFTRLSEPFSTVPEDPYGRFIRQLGFRTYGKSNSEDKENTFLQNLIRNHIDAGRGTFLWDLGTTVNGSLMIDVKDNQKRRIGFVKIGASFEVDKIALNVFGSPGVNTPGPGRARTTAGPPSIALLGGSVEFSADRFSVGAKFKMVRMALDDGEKPLSGLFNCSISYKIPQVVQFGIDVPTYVAPASATRTSAPLVFVLPTARILYYLPTRRVRMDVGN